tara:strand:- start:9707 stop:9961 length:255 start_codon:yes stop_codon:yes gene_type:complete
MRPKVTTICIKSFFLEETMIASNAKIIIKTPRIEGIYDVNEALPLRDETIRPHKNRNDPYTRDTLSIFIPINLYSVAILFNYTK